MRERVTYFVYGTLFGIFLAGSSVGAVAENIEAKVRGYTYSFAEWRREREIKRKQEQR